MCDTGGREETPCAGGKERLTKKIEAENEARKAGPVDNFCVSDKVMPAYPEDHTLATHVEDLELP